MFCYVLFVVLYYVCRVLVRPPHFTAQCMYQEMFKMNCQELFEYFQSKLRPQQGLKIKSENVFEGESSRELSDDREGEEAPDAAAADNNNIVS